MFSNVRFPEDISYGSAGGPVYSTDIVTSASGAEKRNSNWSQSRAIYNVAHGVKTKTQLDALIAFFRAHKGRAFGFRFKDWSDYQAINSPINHERLSIFQLTKHYSSGDHIEQRVITKPVENSLTIYDNGTAIPFTADYTTGEITLQNPPSSTGTLTADFEFDVPVRFETDQLIARLDDYGLYSWSDITLVEVRQ